MANFNRIVLIGRVMDRPEMRDLTNTRVAKFTMVVASRPPKKDPATGEWEKDPSPMFIDVEIFNRGEFGKLADLAERLLDKQVEICLEGKLALDRWDDKTTGQKRSKHKILADNFQLLGSKQDRERAGGGGHGDDMGDEAPAPRQQYNGRSAAPASPPARPAPPAANHRAAPKPVARPRPDDDFDIGGGGNDEDIPF